MAKQYQVPEGVQKVENGAISPGSCQRPAVWHFHIDDMKNPICDSNHWRRRAEQAQAKADQISGDATLKRKLLRVAEEYKRLSQRAVQWRSAEKSVRRFGTVNCQRK